MKRLLLPWFLFLAFFAISAVINGQDIPLFSQKLTNSFMYNPALAGHTFGSLTVSHRQNYTQVDGAPTNTFISIHAPLAKHKFGIGANFFQEDVTFLRNTYASAAFAYHIKFDKFTSLSMGVAGEYNAIGTKGTPITDDLLDPEYDAINQGSLNHYDYSFGLHFQNRFLKAGIAANRLSSTWMKDEATLSNYYTVFAQGLIPVRGGQDLLEPYVAYRKLSDVNNNIDAGLFYTYNNLITAGAAWRSGGVVSGTVAFRPSKHLLFGYSREIITGNVGGFVGAANEFTLRYDFSNESYKERFRADYKSAVSYRRKTVSSSFTRPGGKGPKQLHKKQKKLAPYSPNRRYQNIKKLGVKTSSYKKKGSPAKRKKYSPPRGKSNFKKKRR
ncbi:MAG TPA: PorP/SprF family type IX secretion system membrane protein [Ohtaekwangia sp.]|nr:PorP/SprF family type IX secretion system membrane protein [Ohtaekwangia sp.]